MFGCDKRDSTSTSPNAAARAFGSNLEMSIFLITYLLFTKLSKSSTRNAVPKLPCPRTLMVRKREDERGEGEDFSLDQI